MDEKQIEQVLCDNLRAAVANPAALSSFALSNSTSGAKTLAELAGTNPYQVIQDNNDWNPFPKFMVDIAGGIRPYVVLRSLVSSENRVYMEVKKTQCLS